ncbi:hypothetical protein CYMTET_36384, partial [Cymbomonas tetramitiformis]
MSAANRRLSTFHIVREKSRETTQLILSRGTARHYLWMLTALSVVIVLLFAKNRQLAADNAALELQLQTQFQRLKEFGANASLSSSCNASKGDSSEKCAMNEAEEDMRIPGDQGVSFWRVIAVVTASLLLLVPFTGPPLWDTFILPKFLFPEEQQEHLTYISKRGMYLVDFWFSTYPWMKGVFLLGGTVYLLVLGALAFWGVTNGSFLAALWVSWGFIADSGNHSGLEGASERLVGTFVTLGGMMVFALMLSLVAEHISEMVDTLKRGKSDVVEKDHTLILGWSDKLLPIVEQIALANDSEGGGVVVVLSARNKQEMEEAIGQAEFSFRGTKVVCRTGTPLLLADLNKVSVSAARAIIVLSEASNADMSDANTLRIMLSLRGVIDLDANIVAEISDVDNEAQVESGFVLGVCFVRVEVESGFVVGVRTV